MSQTKVTVTDSTLVKSYTVDDERGLIVELASGDSYLYPTATRKHLDGLANAESKGAFFAKVIRNLESEKI